jgi:glycosyltransferase involved in cell wall biosynthesis
VTRRLAVITPCRNEQRYIEAFVAAVLAQSLPADCRLELVVADGMSDDGTTESLCRLAAGDPRLVLVDNPRRIVSTGLNLALEATDAEVIIRMDVHTDYAGDYVARCVAALDATGADNVGGPWQARPDPGAGPVQRAVAGAFQSPAVAGGAQSRRVDLEGWVDTVYLGCWPRATFERFGGFDESLVRNQDDEHNLRLTLGGGRIWQTPSIRSAYRPRATLAQVFRQYLQYGYWKPFVMKKHRQPASLRHLVPSAFVVAVAGSSGVALVGGPGWLLGGLLGLYGAAVLALTAEVARHVDRAAAVRVPAVIAAYHLSYGIGSLAGWWDALRHGEGRPRFAVLTR